VIVFVLATIVTSATLSFADTGDAAPKNDLERYSTTILSSHDHVTVSWQVRSPGTVRLRLYREQSSGGEILVEEVIAEPGVSSFEFVDDERPPGNTIYVIRVLGPNENETTLGSALCVEPKFAPSVVTSAGSSYQPACTRETVELPDPRSVSLVGPPACVREGQIPAPEPPVPKIG
jgi:hypothetical protein